MYIYIRGRFKRQLLTQNEGKKISLSTVQSIVFFPGKYGGAVERLATAVRWVPVVVRVRVDGGGGWAERGGGGDRTMGFFNLFEDSLGN